MGRKLDNRESLDGLVLEQETHEVLANCLLMHTPKAVILSLWYTMHGHTFRRGRECSLRVVQNRQPALSAN